MTTDHYPVRRRGEARRLNPNRAGARWLEDEDANLTEIITVRSGSLEEGDDLLTLCARGSSCLGLTQHVRPMFQVMPAVSSIHPFTATWCPNPCPNCDDWSRTARCDEHQDNPPQQAARMNAWPIPGTEITTPIREADESVQAREDTRLRGLIAGLRDFSVTLEGTFNPGPFRLEVSGETLQGIQSFSIEVEPNDETLR